VRATFTPPVLDPEPLRRRLLERAEVGGASRVAALGPGLAGTLRSMTGGSVVSLDHEALSDPLDLDSDSVDVAAGELTLMWLPDPAPLVEEIHRILRPGGRAVLTAEPDLHGAVEYPPGAAVHGLLAGILRRNGADPACGRRLRSLFGHDKWSSELFIHPPDPRAGPVGEDLEALVGSVRTMLGREVQEAVLDRWESEVRAASRGGSLLVYAPWFALLSRKRVS
jgi:SAM-dependent methyltransferase